VDALSPAREARALTRAGWWIGGGLLAPIAAWMALAPLSMAVVAPGLVKVDLNRRPVQHLEGGIVREVLVRDGQRVRAGDPVIVLGDVGVDADRNRLRYRLQLEEASVARLEAEQALAREPRFPEALRNAAKTDERLREAITKETSLFHTRRDALESQVALLRVQRQHLQQEIAALKAQIAQAGNALALQKKDLEANRGLVAGGFISPTRLAQIESQVVDYGSKLEERRSELARAEQRVVDNDLRMKSMQNDYAQQAAGELKASAARLTEIEQELRKSEDAAARQTVAAVASGEVIDLRFNSPGAVVRPGDTIAEIVPDEARLMIEARIRPEDVAHVQPGQTARVRFTAFRYRNSSTVPAAVAYVSGDRLNDRQTGQPYYSVLVAVDPASLATAGDVRVQAGMPTEVYIEGTRQTALQYMLEPVTVTLRRAAREL
jgi:HlyD family secretion protein